MSLSKGIILLSLRLNYFLVMKINITLNEIYSLVSMIFYYNTIIKLVTEIVILLDWIPDRYTMRKQDHVTLSTRFTTIYRETEYRIDSILFNSIYKVV